MRLSVLLLAFLICGCVGTGNEIIRTQYQYIIPDKIERPVKPVLVEFNENESMCSYNNFKALQVNMLMITTYIQSLNQTIDYYETYIDDTNIKLKNSQNTQNTQDSE